MHSFKQSLLKGGNPKRLHSNEIENIALDDRSADAAPRRYGTFCGDTSMRLLLLQISPNGPLYRYYVLIYYMPSNVYIYCDAGEYDDDEGVYRLKTRTATTHRHSISRIYSRYTYIYIDRMSEGEE